MAFCNSELQNIFLAVLLFSGTGCKGTKVKKEINYLTYSISYNSWFVNYSSLYDNV